MMFGMYSYPDMVDANATLAPIYFYPFMIVFYYIVMSFFSVKILS